MAGTPEGFAAALVELASNAIVEIGPAIGSDAMPASHGVIALRLDVDFSAPEEDGR